MISYPNAKINIGLNILKRRTDGYHDIDSVIYPIPFSDILEIIESDTFDFTSSGLPIPGEIDGNLCVQAYRLIKEKHSIPNVRIHLHKIIPMGGGLGGGSSDGAFCLKLLNKIFELDLSVKILENYASKLGSDCPFFIGNAASIATETGTQLTPTSLNLSGWKLLLVIPDTHVPTAEAYSSIVPRSADRALSELITQPTTYWKGAIENQFEESVFKLYPQLKNLKLALYEAGAVYASLSGSGSSLYGLFENKMESIELPARCKWIDL